MKKRNSFFHVRSEDFDFVRPETQRQPNAKEHETKGNEVEEEEYYRDEEFRDLYDVSEVQLSNRHVYGPLVKEIIEWLEAVDALSSRIVPESGRLFGDLDPVPVIEELDPAPGSCFNCQRAGHVSRVCPEPREEFCINCGRRGESVINCPRCSRHQRDFFARRRDEGRRRAASAGRAASLARVFDERQDSSVAEVARSGSSSRRDDARCRADEAGAERSSEALVRGKPEGSGLPRWRTGATNLEGPSADCSRGNINNGAPSQKPKKKRSPRRRSGRRERRRNNQDAYIGRYGRSQPEGRRMPAEPIIYRSAEGHSAGPRRERERDSIYAMVEEWRQALDGIQFKTESRRSGEAQQTENHVARERQSLLPSADATRHKCAYTFLEYLKRVNCNYLGIELKRRSEEEKIPMRVDSDEYIDLLEEVDYHIGTYYCRLMISMRLSRPEVERLLAVIKEIQYYDRDMKGMIILGELLFESPEPKWWRVTGNQGRD